MKTTALLFCLLILSGCSQKHGVMADLNLNVNTRPSAIYTNVSAVITGRDNRASDEVISFQLGNEPVLKVPNLNAPHRLVTAQLAEGFKKQGLILVQGASNRIQVDIDTLLVTITRPKVLYNAEARSQITFTVSRSAAGSTLTKKYDRKSLSAFVARPDIDRLEAMLTDQLHEIIEEILTDQNVRDALGQS